MRGTGEAKVGVRCMRGTGEAKVGVTGKLQASEGARTHRLHQPPGKRVGSDQCTCDHISEDLESADGI